MTTLTNDGYTRDAILTLIDEAAPATARRASRSGRFRPTADRTARALARFVDAFTAATGCAIDLDAGTVTGDITEDEIVGALYNAADAAWN
ncbi:hypothetical protein ACFYOC_25495 [Nocardiopsis alba]|uniref:hypothetical protein n=1 Tax=Nocardiopsis alba TaxID=53437 RepID=UPI0036949505